MLICKEMWPVQCSTAQRSCRLYCRCVLRDALTSVPKTGSGALREVKAHELWTWALRASKSKQHSTQWPATRSDSNRIDSKRQVSSRRVCPPAPRPLEPTDMAAACVYALSASTPTGSHTVVLYSRQARHVESVERANRFKLSNFITENYRKYSTIK